jgi:hypothetical protein
MPELPGIMYTAHSSMIHEYGYENGEVYIKFNNGKVYAYPGTEADLSNLKSAESAGKYFNENIKTRTWRIVE